MLTRGSNALWFACAVLAACLWGGNFVAVRVALEFCDPFFLTALRFGAIALFVPFLGWPAAPLKTLLLYAAFSCIGQYLLSTLALFLGLSAGVAALVMQFQVFFSIAFAWAFLKEASRATTMIGSMVGFAGLCGVLLSGHESVPAAGFFTCLVAAACWAGAGLILRTSKADLFQMQASAALLALPVMSAACFVLGGDRLFVAEKIVAQPLVAVVSFAYIAVASFVVAQVLWGRAIRTVGVSVVAPFSLLIPIVGIWLAAFILGEHLGGQLLAWTGLAILGLGLHFFPLLLTTKALAHGIGQGK